MQGLVPACIPANCSEMVLETVRAAGPSCAHSELERAVSQQALMEPLAEWAVCAVWLLRQEGLAGRPREGGCGGPRRADGGPAVEVESFILGDRL